MSELGHDIETAHAIGLAKLALWIPENEALWRKFCELADRMRERGRENYSARTLVEVMRWHTHLQETPDEAFKINNNWAPKFARLYNEARGVNFFRLRDKD